MTRLLSLEFFVVVLCIVNVFLFIAMGLIIRRINRRYENGGMHPAENLIATPSPTEKPKENTGDETTAGSAREILDMLTPLVAQANDAATSFDRQIREKRGLIKTINEALDSRIISINLLLSRAETLHQKLEERQNTFQDDKPKRPVSDPLPSGSTSVVDQQNQIIDLYHRKMDVDTIAQKLSLPKGEVQLVIDLKEKFIAMEQT
ncbi:MAG: DUF6115 domain-containing protein [Desulfotignum sp.]